MRAILSPLKGEKLVYLTPGGGFSFIFQISLYAGLIMAAPIMLYHIHSFVKPALPARAQHSVGKIIIAAVFLMIGGISYGYFIAVPAALDFLTHFAGDAVIPNLTAESYLSFFLAYTGGLALLSLLPLLLVFWHWINPLTPGGLLKSERWVIVFSFVAAAIVTPTPDVVNQTMIAGPVLALYQIGVIAVLITIRRTKKTNRAAQRRQLVLQQVEERRARALRTQAAYLANANSTSANIPVADTTFAIAANANIPAAQTSTQPRIQTANKSLQPTSNPARLRYAGISSSRTQQATSRNQARISDISRPYPLARAINPESQPQQA